MIQLNSKINAPFSKISTSLVERRVRRQLDETLSDLENTSPYFVLPRMQMELTTQMYTEQSRRLERITREGFECFNNMLTLMYSPFFPGILMNANHGTEQIPSNIEYSTKPKLKLIA